MEAEYAARSATGGYRTSPLPGVWQHPPYFHDGSAKDLALTSRKESSRA